jgi:hypothetical protein
VDETYSYSLNTIERSSPVIRTAQAMVLPCGTLPLQSLTARVYSRKCRWEWSSAAGAGGLDLLRCDPRCHLHAGGKSELYQDVLYVRFGSAARYDQLRRDFFV